jgi:hypothetical protein
MHPIKKAIRTEEKIEMTATEKLRTFLESFQGQDGKILSENSIKATAEYLLVQRFCPEIQIGDMKEARTYLRNQLPSFASWEVTKGFYEMQKIWQIAVGIPEDTLVLSHKFLTLSLSDVMPVSVKSSLLLCLFLQKAQVRITHVLEDVIEYQKELFKTVSLESLYETTHNLMTFFVAQKDNEVEDIIYESCAWLSETLFSCTHCIDLLAEARGVSLLCDYDSAQLKKIPSLLHHHQNDNGGFPIFVGGRSEFHPSLMSLWAVTCSDESTGSFVP